MKRKRFPLEPKKRVWVLLSASVLLMAGAECRRAAPTDSRVTPSASAGSPQARTGLQITSPQHDFGVVVQGAASSHSFELSNAGLTRLELEGTTEALGCRGQVVPHSLAPGTTARLDVTCRPQFYGPLRVTLAVRSTTSETVATVELRGSVTPLLAFDTPLVDLRMPFGEERSWDVHVRGALADQASLRLRSTGDSRFVVTPLPPTADAKAGLRLRVKGEKVGVHVGNLVFSTSLSEPSELSLPYSCDVVGSLAVTPNTPYFDLKSPAGQVLQLAVQSSQPGFAVRAVRIAEGPFSASFARAEASGQYTVTVRVRAERIASEARGSVGRLVIVSNDRAEPEKELPLFAFGGPNNGASE